MIWFLMKKIICFLSIALFFIQQSVFSVFDIKYPENHSRIPAHQQLSVLLHATQEDIIFHLNGQKIIMETEDAKSRYMTYVYGHILKPGFYSLKIKDRHEEKSVGFTVYN